MDKLLPHLPKTRRHVWRPCPRCGGNDWFYGTQKLCRSCKSEYRNSPDAIRKRTAQTIACEAIRKGTLIRESCLCCVHKGHKQDGISHAHHEDYAKPLDVIWLCPMHHRWRHLGMVDDTDLQEATNPVIPT